MTLNQLRVGLVGPLPPPFGGMANQTRQLAELLAGEGVKVEVVQVNAPYRPAWIGRLPILRALFRLLPYLHALWRLAGRIDVMHIMANSGWSWHLFATPAVWMAKLRNIPTIINYRGGEAEHFLENSANTVGMTIRQAALLVVPSGFLKEVFARFGMHAEIVPNIINLDRFSNPIPRTNPRRHLLVARNLEPIYDNETAIRAFATVHQHYPDSRLTIAGSGPERLNLGHLVSELALDHAVTFAGRLPPEAMACLYRDSDIAINPSLVDNMPNSVLEALASALPVVSTDVGGVPHIVRNDETALLVPAASPEKMANAVLRLIEDPQCSTRLITNGLVEVQRYAWKEIWPLWQKVYLDAMQPTSGPFGRNA